MSANLVYYDPLTPTTFGNNSNTVLWSPQNEAAGKGRISNVWDRGSGAQPGWYTWRMQTKWAATATSGEQERLYLVTSNASATAAQTDGGLTFGDAELSAETALQQQCLLLGAVISGGSSGAECASSGGQRIYISERYVAVAMWNASAAKALTNTAADHVFTLTPVPDQIQAAA